MGPRIDGGGGGGSGEAPDRRARLGMGGQVTTVNTRGVSVHAERSMHTAPGCLSPPAQLRVRAAFQTPIAANATRSDLDNELLPCLGSSIASWLRAYPRN